MPIYRVQDMRGDLIVTVAADSVAELQRKWHDIADCILLKCGYSSADIFRILNSALEAVQVGK
jgi:hypothetical protein